jgi:hypothetical protein
MELNERGGMTIEEIRKAADELRSEIGKKKLDEWSS